MDKNYFTENSLSDEFTKKEKVFGIQSIFKKIVFIFLMLFCFANAFAQVDVTATAGTLNGNYTSLNAAFSAINAGTHQGTITISLTGNTTETVSAILNSGAVGPASFTSVNITATVPVTISGNIAGAVIKLNGADNVTIDGRIGGVGRNITVQNTSTAAATAAIWLSSVAAGNGASNNIVRNLELLTGIDTTASGNATFGIIMCGTTVSTTSNGVDNDNNSFIANRIIKARYGIVTRGTTTDLNIAPIVTDNIIGPNAFGTDQISKVGIFMQADTGALVSRNTVQFVGVLEPQAATGSDRVGIAIGSEAWSVTAATTLTSANYTVTKNIIHDIVEENTFSSVGIILGTTQSGAATNNLVANNMIYNIRANGTSGDQVCGIGISGGNGDRIVNNSISITGDMDPGASTASATNGNAIRISGANAANNANFLIENNSFYLDASSSSTAALRYYAITLNSNAYVFGTGGLNYNNYYINGANAQLQTGGLGASTGNTQTTQFASLANWQAALTAPQDANSIQANPNYLSPTSDLRISGSSPNINAGTTIVGVTEDFDGELRPNGGTYDIGSDEFYALPGVLQLSSATYSGNEGTTLVVTVTRTSGSTGAVSVDYTLTNATANGTAACGIGTDYVNPGVQTLNFADGISSINFNIPLCSDLVIDPAETFTIALSSPTGGATIGAISNATVTIGDVPPPLNGTYTVGTSGNYPSLTNPGGIFEALNLSGASGNIIINIISDLTGETGTFGLNELAGGYTTLIQPSGAPRTITGSINGALIKINGADGVTINGSTIGATVASCLVGGDTALRQLTIQNTNVGTSAVVISVQSGTNGAQNNTLKNINVVGQDPTTTLIGISLGGNTPGNAGTDNDNNMVENCSVQKAIFGIYSAGQNLANQNSGTVIKYNDLSSTGTNRIRRVGIVLFNENGSNVSYNSISVDTNESADGIGIAMGIQAIDATSTTSGSITGALVSHNKINGVVSSSTTGFSAVGISVSGAVGAPNIIQNNMISGVSSPATSPDLTAGIYVVGVTGADTRLYNNTVSMSGDRGTVASQMPSFAIAITGTDPIIDLRNNILNTTQIASGGGANAKSYAIGMVTTAFTNLNSNYNNFNSSGAQDGGFRSGSLSTAAGTDYATLALWTAAITDDVNSVEIAPVFVSTTDLHLDTANNQSLDNLGTPIAAVTSDFDCQARSATTPDMGADEFCAITSNVTDVVACDTYTWSVNGTTYTTSGTYTNVVGCHTETLNLTINVTPVADSPSNVSACDSYTLPALTVGNYFTGSNGTGTALTAGTVISTSQTIYVYAQTGTTPNCFDENSFTVTITPSTSNTTNIAACDSYTWSVNGTTYTTSGTYTNVVGCHTETLNLTITPSTSNTTTASACDSYTWSVNGTTYTTSGTYTNVVGCHTETLNLTITPSTSNSTTASACDSYTWSVNGTTYTTSGTYTNVVGCHTETLNLTITPSTSNTTTASACDSYTWSVNGITYTSSGTYVVSPSLPNPTYCAAGSNTNGCSTGDEYINNVTFGSINQSSACGTGMYQDFTGVSTSVTAGNTYPISISNANNFGGDQVSVWVDWNQNGSFTDSGEVYTLTYATVTNGSIAVPSTALNGTTRMRVRLNYTGTMSPCGNTTYGEVEDYTVLVSGGVTPVYCHTETLNLTITPSTTNTTTASACDSYTWSVNGTTYTTSGTYTNVVGCHTETLNLTITPSTSNSTTASACDSYTWSVNGTTYTTSGTYTNVVGCHTETLNLTITPSTSNSTTASACDSYTWSVNGTTYTTSGTYTNVVGCHTETLNLTITPSTSNSTTASACDSYTWSVNGTTYTTSGTYTNVVGCHTETLNLTITPSTTNTTTASACNSYTWSVNGTTYTASGTYTNVVGCHTETLNLTINSASTPTGASTQTINGGVASDVTIEDIVVSGTNIVWYPTAADAAAGTNAIAAGTQLVDGATYYAVSVNGSCVSSPLAVTVTVVLGKDSFDITQLTYYPNPVVDQLSIRYNKEITTIEIFDLGGKLVKVIKPFANEVHVDMVELSSSIYILKVYAEDNYTELKVIKK